MILTQIRPSAAAKWFRCSGQPRIAEIAKGWPQDDVYTAEGTLAHAYLAARLTENEAPVGLPEDQRRILDLVIEEIQILQDFGGYMLASEVALGLSFTKHQMDLTADIVLYNATDLIVLDYKHGEGMQVAARDNPQLMLYLAGAREICPGRQNMQIGIIQPRGQGEGWDKVEVTHEELDAFLVEVDAAITDAYAERVQYVPGPHCQFCPGTKNPICPAQLQIAIDAIMAGEEAEISSWWLLDHIEDLRKTIKGVDTAANVWLKSGRDIDGWCLESQPGRRKWCQPDEVAPVLAELLGGSELDYQVATYKPITMTEALKLARRKKVDIGALIETGTTVKRVRGNKNFGFEEIE